jgi:hypothetical protein
MDGDATAGRHPSPFQAIPPVPSNDGERAAPLYDAAPSATTGEPVSNPSERGELLEPACYFDPRRHSA